MTPDGDFRVNASDPAHEIPGLGSPLDREKQQKERSDRRKKHRNYKPKLTDAEEDPVIDETDQSTDDSGEKDSDEHAVDYYA